MVTSGCVIQAEVGGDEAGAPSSESQNFSGGLLFSGGNI